MANFKQITTPAGTAVYPHLRTTECFEGNDSGKYTCSIKFEDKNITDKLMARIEDEWEAAKKSSDFEGKRFGRNTFPSLGFRENKEGEIVFKAKTNAVLKTKAGEIVEITVPVFDKYNKPMDIEMEVGNGSTIQMCFALRPFYASSSIYGLQLLLKAVRVIEYVAPGNGGGQTAESFGFEASEEEDNDCPFSSMGESIEF